MLDKIVLDAIYLHDCPAAEPFPFQAMTPHDFIKFEARLFRELSAGDSSKVIEIIHRIAPRIREFVESRRYHVTPQEILVFVRRTFPADDCLPKN